MARDPAGPGTMAEVGSGRFDGGLHRFSIRIYYEDTDAGGIVYHANYLRFAERARTEMMRLAGAEHAAILAETGVAFTVRRCVVDFLAPARLDDAVEVESRVTGITGARLMMHQAIRRIVPGQADLAALDLTLACVDRAGRPVRLPEPVRRALAHLTSI